MTEREFEKQVKKLCPKLKTITYQRNLIGNKFTYNVVYVHYGSGFCRLAIGPNCFEKMLKQLGAKNEPTS